ncbi:MAG: DUF3090 family protein [Candidatus Dormibacterales bacterium]
MAIFELDPVDLLAVAAVGEPGRRHFFLIARGSGRTMTLGCEKAQIQALLVRLQQVMESQGIERPERQPATGAPEPGEPEWQVAEMGLGYHEGRGMFVLVVSQAASEAPEEEMASVRFWLSRNQVLAFSMQAENVLGAGRPLCPRCGLPMDPVGHPCPVMNGARPIF